MTKWLIALTLMLPGAAMAAVVWTWMDADGVRHYSDRPVDGAERIEINEVQSFSAPAARPAAPQRAPEPTAQSAPYERLSITEPEQTETLWNIEGMLQVTVDIAPPLRPGDQIDLFLDGERQYLNSRQLSFTVDEVYRGVHALEAAVFDASGEEVMRSPTRNFVVQQTSLLNPNNPQTSPPGPN